MMRKSIYTSLVTLFMLVVAGAMPAMAQVRYHLTSSDPESGSTVESLKIIQTVWTGEETDYGYDVSKDKSAVTVTDAAGEQITTGTLRNVPSGVQIRLAEEITEFGTYTLTVKPDMVYAVGDFDYDTGEGIPMAGTGNEAVSLVYTIAAPVVRYTLVSADPESGSTVESLKIIQTVWTGEETDYGYDVSKDKSAVTVTDAAGEQITTGTLRNVPSGVQIRLAEEITKSGTYTLTVKPDMVYAVGDFDYDTGEGIPMAGTGNEAVTLTYIIDDSVVGVSFIDADNPDAVYYYDLNGNMVKTPGRGVYIRVKGDKVTKVIN